MAQIIHIGEHRVGQTLLPIEFVLVDDITGDPLDLSGLKILCQFRFCNDKSPVEWELTDEDGLTISTTETGKITFDEAVPPMTKHGVYVFDFRFTWPDGMVEYPLEGDITILNVKSRN